MENSIIDRIFDYSNSYPEHTALYNPSCMNEDMTYKALFGKAFSLAQYLIKNVQDKAPIVVYGHKNPYMIVCFLACSLSGHAYCPVDKSMPLNRVESIVKQTKGSILLSTEDIQIDGIKILKYQDIKAICSEEFESSLYISDTCVKGQDTYYIIFTSGSTGDPKGVEISFDDLNNFLEWSSTLGDEKPYGRDSVFLNQAPFSFDLSVMDLYTSLYCGSTLCMMDKSIQMDIGKIVPFIKDNKITSIVATPSFVNMCLVDKNFNCDNIPTIENFFFCGETLQNKTAEKVLKRFPNAVVQNTYGPTESTVAVSGIRITNDILDKYDPLPIGYAKKGTGFIIEPDANSDKISGEGEILITGNTLAKGYFGREDLTSKAFINYNDNGNMVRAYKTGDLGYLEDDLLFYIGRRDFQIKLNGYRIELGDIENSLLKNKDIAGCSVVPIIRNNQVKNLVAAVVLVSEAEDKNEKIDSIKAELLKYVPPYMVPANFMFLDAIPMTTNGKADRKKIIDLFNEE